jgi:hypothetical protein
MDWLEPLRQAVLRARLPVQFFFRDDDAGWADETLLRLVDLFQAQRVPLDLAVIPQALSDALARELRTRRSRTPDLLGVHQHGFAHANHEQQGRKCEFGPARSSQAQEDDLTRGRARLERMLGTCDPIFTPPWNRCTQDTVQGLVNLGFETLSRDVTAHPLCLDGLREIPVAVDWCKGPGEAHARTRSAALRAAARVDRAEPVGIMLHHCVMNEDDFHCLEALLGELRAMPQAHCLLMRSIDRAKPECRRADAGRTEQDLR